MVVNQKSKYEMKHNLALFLGDIVDKFVNWLFDYLSQINNKDESVENEQSELFLFVWICWIYFLFFLRWKFG